MLKVSSHQPSFFPWAGYWNKVISSDVHIMSGAVQFDHGGYQNRCPLGDQWITLPIVRETRHGEVRDVRYHREALPKLFQTLRQEFCGRKKKHADRAACVIDFVEEFGIPSDYLLDLNLSAFAAVKSVLSIKAETSLDTVAPYMGESKTQRLCSRVSRHVSPNEQIEYLAGSGAMEYIDPQALPMNMSMWVQRKKPTTEGSTVLKLISESDNPVDEIMNGFYWEEIPREENTGDLSARG